LKKLLCLLVFLLMLVPTTSALGYTSQTDQTGEQHLLWDIPFGVDVDEVTALAAQNASAEINPINIAPTNDTDIGLMLTMPYQRTLLSKQIMQAIFHISAVDAPSGTAGDANVPYGFDGAFIWFDHPMDKGLSISIEYFLSLCSAACTQYGSPCLTLLSTQKDASGNQDVYDLPLVNGEVDRAGLTAAFQSGYILEYNVQFGSMQLLFKLQDDRYILLAEF